MRLAIIGSRRRSEARAISHLLSTLQPELVITGGAEGIDTEAAIAAADLSIACRIIRPALAGKQTRGQVMKAIRERNEEIVETADAVVAFPAANRTGGTEMGIHHAQRLGKPLIISANNGQVPDTSLLVPSS